MALQKFKISIHISFALYKLCKSICLSSLIAYILLNSIQIFFIAIYFSVCSKYIIYYQHDIINTLSRPYKNACIYGQFKSQQKLLLFFSEKLFLLWVAILGQIWQTEKLRTYSYMNLNITAMRHVLL